MSDSSISTIGCLLTNGGSEALIMNAMNQYYH